MAAAAGSTNNAVEVKGLPVRAMDAKFLQEKAALCSRLADGLSLNNPARFQLMDLAEDLREHVKELERQEAEQNKQ